MKPKLHVITKLAVDLLNARRFPPGGLSAERTSQIWDRRFYKIVTIRIVSSAII